jgi:hypothetical protein
LYGEDRPAVQEDPFVKIAVPERKVRRDLAMNDPRAGRLEGADPGAT